MKAAYFFTDLPDIQGTFPVSELLAMSDRGIEIEIYCLRSRLASGEGAETLRSRFPVHRSSYLPPGSIASFLHFLRRRPKAVLGSIISAISQTYRSPRILMKTLGIFPKCVQFARQIETGDFDWLQAYWASLPGRAAWWISRLSGTPYGTWAHAGADIYNRRFQTVAALRCILEDARLILTCNRTNLPYMQEILSPAAVSRLHYHPHGINVDVFRPADRSAAGRTGGDAATPLRLLSVGRLSEAKGFPFAIRACALLRDRGRDVQYRIIGDGPDRPELEALIETLGLQDVVVLAGHLDQRRVAEELREADVFVVPSVIGREGSRDGLPNVLLEAMAASVAAIGSETVGIPEAIRHEETGILVPPGDPEALASGIEGLAASPERRRALAAAGRQLVLERYTQAPCMDQLAEILRASAGE